MRFVKPTRVRLLSQVFFFLLFLFLLLHTEFRGSMHTDASDIRLPYPVNLFFRLDPLVPLSNALASRSLYHGLLWNLLILIPTIFLGRFFCGWICPLGSIHHFFSSRKSERKRGKQLIESNRYKRWQTTKYYLLGAGLIAAAFGSGILGWLDPFSLLVRSLGLSVLPATDYGLRATLSTLEHSRYAFVQTVGSVLHFILGALLLSFKQPYFRHSQVCPTGAIWEITAKEKGWSEEVAGAKPIRLGTAFYSGRSSDELRSSAVRTLRRRARGGDVQQLFRGVHRSARRTSFPEDSASAATVDRSRTGSKWP